MSSNSVLNAVQHYQRSIEKSIKNPTDVARLLHCVGKLYKIPITVEHLQQTGVGRTVNDLRKHDGELGVAADAVVNKWKQLVAAESDIRAGNQSSENEQEVDDEEDDNYSEKNMQTNYNDSSKVQSNEHTLNKQYSHSANKSDNSKNDSETNKNTSTKHHKPASSPSAHKNHDRHSHHRSEHRDKSKGHHSSKDSKDSHKRDEREHKAHKSQSKGNEKEKGEDKREKNQKDVYKSRTELSTTESGKKHSTSKDKGEHHNSNGKHKHHEKHHSSKEKDKSKSKSSSEHKSQTISPGGVKTSSAHPCSDEPTTSAAAAIAKSSSSGKKRRHDEAEEKGNSPKKTKGNMHHNEKPCKQNSNSNEGDMDDGIDSSMGANFADVLGMLNMPQKKAKKSLNALKSTSPKSAKKTSESDYSKSSSTSKTNGIHNTEMPSSSSSSTSQRKLEKKPDLLNSKVKLPPLDPSIALELPIISNNYKPLPLNPTVMDCVFNSATSSSSRAPPPRLLSDAEALSHGISSKTMRTKVYSGVKTGQLLQVPTLFDLCIRVLQKNIDALEYTGGVPFDVLRSVLERATPQQLFTFEEYNPYVMEDSDVLWKQHVQRNYRSHKRQEMESWREMFMRCQEDQERRLSMLAENIKQSQKAIALPVRKTQLAFVDSMVKPPRNVVRKQEQHGTKSKLVATPAARVAALCSVTPNAAKQGDARLRVAAAFAQDPAKVSSATMRQKKAPLMAKTIQFMRGRLKR